MALATYADLKTAVATWLARGDLTSSIPDFITIAHNKLMRVLRTRDMLTVDTAFSVGAETVAVPSMWQETKSIYLTSTSPRYQMHYVSPQRLIEANVNANTGIPRWYSVVGANFHFGPIPDATYTATHVYYAAVAQMSADSDHNWILDSHPDLYLYGALLESSPFIQDDPRISLWQTLYDRGISEVQRQSQMAESGPAMQVRVG